MKFEFHVGDYVEDVTGRIGYINSICHCKSCKKREFYELHVMYNDGDDDYIIIYEYEQSFLGYKRIGQYDFTKKNNGKIKPLCEDYTKSFPLFKATTTEVDTGIMGKKINELVKAVNRLEEKVNEMVY